MSAPLEGDDRTREGAYDKMNGLTPNLDGLREQARMTWREQEHGWLATPEEILIALSGDGFEECKREMTTSHRDRRPAGGVWQGINPRTGSGASAVWVNRPASHQAILFIDIDGERLVGARASSGASDYGGFVHAARRGLRG